MLLMAATWFSPVLYSWTMVRDTPVPVGVQRVHD